MKPIETFLKRLFGLDPGLTDASKRTNTLQATLNGDPKWMLTCRDRRSETIECDDGHTYVKEK